MVPLNQVNKNQNDPSKQDVISFSNKVKQFYHDFKPFVKYCIVGASGTVIDIGSLYCLVEFVYLPVLTATTLSFIASVINNFVWNKIWTFRNQSTNYKKLFIKFLLVACGGLALTYVCMWFLVHVVQVWYLYAKAMTSLIVLTWNFMANKYWTFQLKDRLSIHQDDLLFDYSIIIPAYNEERRIGMTLQEIDRYRQSQHLNAEIIVVDDGSRDQTVALVNDLKNEFLNLKCVQNEKNTGKGYAIRKGVEAARGRWILFTDADNSTPISELAELQKSMTHQGADIAIGSRYLKESRVKIKQSVWRIMIGRIGNFLIRSFIIEGIRDSQCGFKLFKGDVARDIFFRNKIKRWGFDMEVLAIAKLLKYRIVEVPIQWLNSPDSRLRPLRDAINTFVELLYIKINLWCGRYEE